MPESAQYVTATQAARLVGVNEKTIRLWIKSGKLSAAQAASNRLAIPMSEVQRAITEREQAAALDQTPTPRELAQQVANLARQVEELTRQVEELQDEQRRGDAFQLDTEIHRRDDIPQAARPQRSTTTKRSTTSAGGRDLPPGCLHASDFAALYGVNRITFRDHILKGLGGERVAVEERPKPGREHETERYLTPEQQAAALDFWQRHGVPFARQDAEDGQE
jgi:polyhydroxyalkanoate synthesis regulator phasin